MAVSRSSLVPKLKSMAIAQLFEPPDKFGAVEQVNSMSFSDDGKLCVATTDDGTIQLLNTTTGKRDNVFFDKEFGATEVAHTHHRYGILYTSTKMETGKKGVIVYRSLYDNSVLRYFKHHTDQVTSISVSPTDDIVTTTGYDQMMYVWDLRVDAPVASLSLGVAGHLRARHDGTGDVLALMTRYRLLSLYNLKDITSPPFKEQAILEGQDDTLMSTDIRFSEDGRRLAVATTSTGIELLDGYSLGHMALLNKHPFAEDSPCNIAFSADGSTLCTGGSDGRVWAYPLPPPTAPGAAAAAGASTVLDPAPTPFALGDEYRDVPALESLGLGRPGAGAGGPRRRRSTKEQPGLKHDRPIRAIAWHPTKCMLATACSTFAFWIPKE